MIPSWRLNARIWRVISVGGLLSCYPGFVRIVADRIARLSCRSIAVRDVRAYRYLASVCIDTTERIIPNVAVQVPTLWIIKVLIDAIIRRHKPAHAACIVPGPEVVVPRL